MFIKLANVDYRHVVVSIPMLIHNMSHHNQVLWLPDNVCEDPSSVVTNQPVVVMVGCQGNRL